MKGLVEKMRSSNRRGGAAVVAVLIVIMLVAVGSAVMVVTGRNSIQASKTVEAPPPPGYEDDLSSSEAESSSAPDSSSVPDIPETKPSILPQIADNYKTIDLKDMTAKSAVLINADTNEIVAGYKYDKEIYPASLTKLLTLLVAAENIEDMDATYKFTSDDIDPLIEENASRAGFEADEEVTMKDLLYASILVSGADGTLGLANGVAGSEENFVELMNLKLTELGLSSSHFVNASGLHDEDHYSTVQDIAAITKACLDNDICREILEASSYTTSKTKQHEDGIELSSIFHSRYGGYWIDTDGDGEGDADVLGGKTGFTDEALFTLSSVIEYEGTEYICVTAKSKEELVSVEDTIAILENYLPGAEGTDSGSDDSDSSQSDDTSAA